MFFLCRRLFQFRFPKCRATRAYIIDITVKMIFPFKYWPRQIFRTIFYEYVWRERTSFRLFLAFYWKTTHTERKFYECSERKNRARLELEWVLCRTTRVSAQTDIVYIHFPFLDSVAFDKLPSRKRRKSKEPKSSAFGDENLFCASTVQWTYTHKDTV